MTRAQWGGVGTAAGDGRHEEDRGALGRWHRPRGSRGWSGADVGELRQGFVAGTSAFFVAWPSLAPGLPPPAPARLPRAVLCGAILRVSWNLVVAVVFRGFSQKGTRKPHGQPGSRTLEHAGCLDLQMSCSAWPEKCTICPRRLAGAGRAQNCAFRAKATHSLGDAAFPRCFRIPSCRNKRNIKTRPKSRKPEGWPRNRNTGETHW